MDDEYWKKNLSEAEFNILRLSHTEPRYSSDIIENFENGTYHCKACDQELFKSEHKFKCDCGWPSFFSHVKNAINEFDDYSHNMHRIEVKCSKCDSHLGHVFNDGPKPTFQRYCINGIALSFKKTDTDK